MAVCTAETNHPLMERNSTDSYATVMIAGCTLYPMFLLVDLI